MAYKRELIAQTKNLFDISKLDTTKTLNVTGNVITAKTASDSSPWTYANSQYKTTLDAGRYFLSFDNRSTASIVDPSTRLLIRDDANAWIAQIKDTAFTNNKVSTSFTLDKQTNIGIQFKLYTQAISNFQIEKNSTATDYVPYGHLSSYKKLLKVSDVCQLLDKSKYPATQTVNGVTYTNNGDGTFTISGSATDTNYYRISKNVPLIVTHLYYMGHTSYTGRYCKMEIDNGVRQIDSYNNGIILTCEQTTESSVYIDTYEGEEFNIVYKPQLFDLTEMYGSGNEPTTVDEFKAKFPNELYDYSPRCWVKSYKTGLIAKTKNLFNINALTPYTPETLPIGTAGVYNGNIISRGKSDDTTCSTGKTLRELCPDLAVGETYTLNFETTVPSSIGGQYESIHLRGVGNWWRRNTRTITEADLSAVVYVYADTDLSVYTISNFQIEKGTTATDYVPFGYL